ncbi:MAG TPA: P-loop NTPase [Isosphaeraceae bacterium]|nr:P-loop NTPase [Isosphaeraceae bacterium]
MQIKDQADGLRRLAQSGAVPAPLAEPPPPECSKTQARSLVFTSGKGGVGTSNLALNLAIALGEYGQRVVLVDADFGLANIDLLCGLAPALDLGSVLSGGLPLADAVVTGPAEIRVLPGAHAMRTLVDQLAEGPARLAAELAELEAEADFLLVDAGSGLGAAIPILAQAADQVVVVTTPEPTSLADAHAAFQRLRRNTPGAPAALRTLVNQAASTAEAAETLARLTASSREFMGLVVHPLGHVRADPRVPMAVRKRRPFLVAYPKAVASRCVRRLARTLIEERQPRGRKPGFFNALGARWALGQVVR